MDDPQTNQKAEFETLIDFFKNDLKMKKTAYLI